MCGVAQLRCARRDDTSCVLCCPLCGHDEFAASAHNGESTTAPAGFLPAIWEELARIGREAPAGTWDGVRNDLSMRIDEIVYGAGPNGR